MNLNPMHQNLNQDVNYASALRQLVSLADYERMAGREQPLQKLDLARMEELVSRLSSPQKAVPALHIAGTKGKGSVAAMVSSILRAANLRHMTFTSPHLHSFRERINLDGNPISEEAFVAHLNRIWSTITDMGKFSNYGRPSTFEVLNAMAFEVARTEKVDIQVLEVGLGGRLDSTNVADGEVAVITSLSLDHTEILGDTLDQIAKEKAGIIKPGAKVVISPQEEAASKVLNEKCKEQGAAPYWLQQDITWELIQRSLDGQEVLITTPNNHYNVFLPLLGPHQRENAAAAIASIELLERGISSEAIIKGMANVEWPGRFQVLSKSPYVVADGSHNKHSMYRLRETVDEFIPGRRTILVFGCSSDKDLIGMVEEFKDLVNVAIVCESRHPRALPISQLSKAFDAIGIPVSGYSGVAESIQTALQIAQKDDLILITGSLFTVAEALEYWYEITPEYYPELDPMHQSLSSSYNQEVLR